MELIDRDKMEELLFSIQNAAHTEYHLLEVHEKNYKNGNLKPFIERARATRRVLMNQLMNMFSDNGIGAVWCVIKHALLTHFHLLELYEKDYEKIYIEQAQEVYLMINDLLKHKFDNYSNCARCDGDRNDTEHSDAIQMELDLNNSVYLTESKYSYTSTTGVNYIGGSYIL